MWHFKDKSHVTTLRQYHHKAKEEKKRRHSNHNDLSLFWEQWWLESVCERWKSEKPFRIPFLIHIRCSKSYHTIVKYKKFLEIVSNMHSLVETWITTVFENDSDSCHNQTTRLMGGRICNKHICRVLSHSFGSEHIDFKVMGGLHLHKRSHYF